MKGLNLTDQLFNTLTALSLKQASGLRELSQSEKSLLESSEAKAGPMLKEAQDFTHDGSKNKTPKIIIEIDQPDDFISPCEICGGMESCANGCPNE